MSAAAQEFQRTAHAWLRHLRDGGTTPWLEQVDAGPDHGAPVVQLTGELPGAAQLELLRRVNLAAPGHHLADRLLDRAGPGRGRPELPLLWPHDPSVSARGRAGQPVDPGQLSPEELLRVAAGTLADLSLELPAGRAGRGSLVPGSLVRRVGRLTGLGRPGHPRFRIDGSPVTASVLRAGLAAAGAHEDRRHDPEVVLVVAAPIDQMFFEVWSRRVQSGAARTWPRFVKEWQRRADLPPAAHLASIATHWARVVGAANVHIVTADPRAGWVDPTRVESVLGVRPMPAGVVPRGEARLLAPALVDVVRRHNAVLAVRVPEAERPERCARLLEALDAAATQWADLSVGPARLTVPESARGWAVDSGGRLADLLDRAGYPVEGDVAVLAQLGQAPGRPPGRAVLTAMVRALVALDEQLAAGTVAGVSRGRGR